MTDPNLPAVFEASGISVREWISYIMGGIFAVATGALVLMRRYSNVGLGNARNTDEVSTMTQKNDRIALLEARLDKAYEDRNKAVSEIGAVAARLELLLQASDDVKHALARRERQVDELQRRLGEKLDENTELTKLGIQESHAAFDVANNVNEKIAGLSELQLAEIARAKNAEHLARSGVAEALAAKVALDEKQLAAIDDVGRDTNVRVRNLEHPPKKGD